MVQYSQYKSALGHKLFQNLALLQKHINFAALEVGALNRIDKLLTALEESGVLALIAIATIPLAFWALANVPVGSGSILEHNPIFLMH